MINLDISKLTPAEIYRLMISGVVPRPIAWVSTCSSTGHTNLAPFSFFNAVASSPPTLMISVTYKRDGAQKDTLRNILETGEFVVNSSELPLIDKINRTAEDLPYGVSEFAAAGLTAEPSQMVKPPRVKEASLAWECKLSEKVHIGTPNTPGAVWVIFGQIVAVSINPKILVNGSTTEIDFGRLQPLARLGGQDYMEPGLARTVVRPKF